MVQTTERKLLTTGQTRPTYNKRLVLRLFTLKVSSMSCFRRSVKEIQPENPAKPPQPETEPGPAEQHEYAEVD